MPRINEDDSPLLRTRPISLVKDTLEMEAFRDAVVLIPHHDAWKRAFVFSVMVHIAIVTYNVGYSDGKRMILVYLFDLFFGIDWFLHLVLIFHPEKICILYKRRKSFAMFVDVLTLLPIEMLHYQFEANRLIRVYRIIGTFQKRTSPLKLTPKNQKFLELFIIMALLTIFGSVLLFTTTCYTTDGENCCTLLLIYRTEENYTEEVPILYWYAKSMYVMGTQLTRAGFPHLGLSKPVDKILISAFIFVHLWFLRIRVMPLTLSSCLEHRKVRFDLSEYLPLLSTWLRVRGRDHLLPQLITFFRHIRTSRGPPEESKDFDPLPVTLQREIYMTIHWDIVRISRFFRYTGFKVRRNVALIVKSRHLPPGHVVFRVHEFHDTMVYIVRGTVEVTDEHGERIARFTKGTCLGGANLFYSCPSAFTVKCLTFCEFDFIEREEFQKLADDNFEVHEQCAISIQERITEARQLKNLEDTLKLTRSFEGANISPVAWMKDRFFRVSKRATTVEELFLSGKYVDELVFATKPMLQRRVIAFLLKLLRPGTIFLNVWIKVSTTVIVVAAYLFPYYACLEDRLSIHFIVFTFFLILVYSLDVVMNFVASIETASGITTDPSELWKRRRKEKTFYIDIITIFPIIALYDTSKTIMHPLIALATTVHATKLMKITVFEEVAKFEVVEKIKGWNVLKFIMFILYPLWIWSVVFYALTCTSDRCGVLSWATELPTDNQHHLLLYSTVFMSICVTGVGFMDFTFHNALEYIVTIGAEITFCSLYVYLFADTAARFCLFKYRILECDYFERNIKWVMSERKISRHLRQRVANCLEAIRSISEHQLDVYTLKELEYIPKSMLRSIFRTDIVEMLKHLPLFENTNEFLINELVENMVLHYLPPGEVVVKAGERSSHIFVIENGLCERTPASKALLRKGDIFPTIEVLGHFPAFCSVKCLSFCRILALDEYTFRNILLKHADVQKDIDDALRVLLSKKTIIELEKELKLIDVEESASVTLYTKSQKSFSQHDHQRAGLANKSIYRVFRYLFLSNVILPHGKFLIVTEALRIFFGVLSALVYPLRRFIGWYYPNFYYYIILLDATAYIDIYLRFHHAYHDERGMLVTDIKKICLRYLKHSFITDIFGCFPFDFFFERFLQHSELSLIQGVLYLNRITQIYRMRQILPLLESLEVKINLPVTISLCSLLFLIFSNGLASFAVATQCHFNQTIVCPYFRNDFKHMTNDYRSTYTYLYHLTWIVTLFGNIGCDGMDSIPTNGILPWMILLTMLGYITRITVYALLTANHQYPKHYTLLAQQQQDFKMLNQFMDQGKVKKHTRKTVMEYYYTQWKRTRNIELGSMFKIFHPWLSSQVIFQMFGESLKKCQVLSDVGDDAVRSVLTQARFAQFTKRWRLCRVNDVLDETYILVKGSVIVESVEGAVIATYDVGMMFGNIEPSQWNRTSITVIAVDIVEILAFKTRRFFQRMERFPQFQKVMSMYTQYNTDFIPPVSSHSMVRELKLLESKGYSRIQESGCMPSTRKFFGIPHNPSKRIYQALFWCNMIAILVAYNLVFSEIGERFVSPLTSRIIYMLDLVYIFVIWYKLNRAYYNEYGELVTDLKAIRLHYNSSNEFFFDVLSIIPLDLVYIATKTHFITPILRINRCLRIYSIYKYLHLRTNTLNGHFALKCYLYSLLIMYTCLIPIGSLCVIAMPEERDEHCFYKHGLYTTWHLFALADLRCEEMGTISKVMLSLIAPQLTHAVWVYGVVSACTTILAIYKTLETFSRRSMLIYRYIKARGVPQDSLKEVWNYLSLLWHECEGCYEPRLVGRAPHLMKQMLRNSVYGPIVRKHGFYRHLHRDLLRQMIGTVERCFFLPGNLIALTGVADRQTYFISWGRVEEIIEHQNFTQEKSRTLKGGDVFGILQGVVPTAPYRYTYRAVTKCEILALKYDNWCHLLDFFPAAKYEMYNSANSLYIFSTS